MSTYVVSWCNEGLEGIIPVSELEKKDMWNILQSKTATAATSAVTMMVMRARFNTQRHYEIYSIETTDGITEKDLRNLFLECPQYAADLIREKGSQLFSDRAVPNNIKIS